MDGAVVPDMAGNPAEGSNYHTVSATKVMAVVLTVITVLAVAGTAAGVV